jgi:hypothetical protein
MNVNNWEHKSGYHLNADGKSIEYTHTEKPLLAIVEGMVNEDPNTDIDFQYYTVIFDDYDGIVAPHKIHDSKEKAREHLESLMEEYK